MLHSLQHLQLIVHHLLIAFDILLENYLNGVLFAILFRFTDYTICPSSECISKLVLSSKRLVREKNGGIDG